MECEPEQAPIGIRAYLRSDVQERSREHGAVLEDLDFAPLLHDEESIVVRWRTDVQRLGEIARHLVGSEREARRRGQKSQQNRDGSRQRRYLHDALPRMWVARGPLDLTSREHRTPACFRIEHRKRGAADRG